MYIVLAIIAFGVLIITHELGHFFAAKAFGVKVNEFAVGMGPVLLKKQGKETLYSLRLLPLGGFCAMEGEDEDTGDRSFTAKPKWQRAIILCAGAAMNFLFGLIMLLCIVSYLNVTEPIVADFMDGCPYQGENAIQIGDRITHIDGHRIRFITDFTEQLSRSGGERHRVVLRRDGKRVVLEDFTLVPVEYTEADGSTSMKYGFYFAPRDYGLIPSLRYTWMQAMNFVRLVWRSLEDLVTGAVGLKELSGPVGVIGYVNDVEESAASPLEAFFFFFYIFSLIAINLAVMNLLPIPALDGGRIFFLIVTWCIELITRKKLDPKYEGYIHGAGFILLMGLMLFVMGNDIFKIITNR